MPEDYDNMDTITRMVVGANYSIDLKIDWRFEYDYGMSLQDVVALADNRLKLRCIIPVPYSHEVSKSLNPIDNLDAIASGFRNQGWDLRICDPSGRSMTSLIIDRKTAMFRDKSGSLLAELTYSNVNTHVDYVCRDFDKYWNNSLETDMIEAYHRTGSVFLSGKESHIAALSNQTWSRIINELQRNPNLMYHLAPRKFEELVAQLLIKEGLDVTLTPISSDGGRDILAIADTPIGKHLYLVECKKYNKDNKVGVGIVRSLYGVIMQEKATAGVIVTSSYFTKNALQFAEPIKYQLHLQDFDYLISWLKKLPQE